MAATLSWLLPTGTSNNNFSVTLVSDQALQNVSIDDFVDRTWTLTYDIHEDFDESQLPDDYTLQNAIRAGAIQGEGS